MVAASFIGGGNQCARRKPLTCRKSLANFMWEHVRQSRRKFEEAPDRGNVSFEVQL
jgi:hypothetical protein